MVKTILVLGSAGLQGGAVAKILQSSGQYQVRCLVPDVSKPYVNKLIEMGVAICPGRLSDSESIRHALSNVDALFHVQDCWEGVPGHDVDADKELVDGKRLVDLAKSAGISHYIYSTFDDCDGVPHFHAKHEIECYLKASGIPFTILRSSFYFENFVHVMPPELVENNRVVFHAPVSEQTPIPMTSATDLGWFVLYALDHAEESIGRTIDVVAEVLTFRELMDAFTHVTGFHTRFDNICNEDDMRTLGWKGVHELMALFKFFQARHGLERDLSSSAAIRPGMVTWDSFCRGVAWKDVLVRRGNPQSQLRQQSTANLGEQQTQRKETNRTAIDLPAPIVA